jgi:hypothetical protein
MHFVKKPNSEKLDLKIDVKNILASVKLQMDLVPAIEWYPGYGGWPILSISRDGNSGLHESAYVLNQDGEMDETKTINKSNELKLPDSFSYKIPTSFFNSNISGLLFDLQFLGFEIARMRLSYMNPGSSLFWHRDVPPNKYGARLHIPLATNSQCLFEFDNEQIHMPNDGSGYLVRINRRHRYVNNGTTRRLHLVMDIRDHHKKTEYFKYPEDI